MQSCFDTPILFIIFNRPDTTAAVFEQIRKQRPAQLFLAADGPRSELPGEWEKCEATRQIVNQVDWDCDVRTWFRTANAGCGPAVSSAISWFFGQVPEGIILEDDCLPDPSFFRYCQELLEKYRYTQQVKMIGGINFQDGKMRGSGSYYFSYYPEIWGWASWHRAWQEYDYRMNDLEKTVTAGTLNNGFQTERERKYWYGRFKKTKAGEINTWDYQWTYTILKNGGLAISPQVNLVKNIGLRNNATHFSLRDSKMEPALQPITFPLVHPEVTVDKQADRYTFSRIYDRSAVRAWRLLKENGMQLPLYLLQRLLQQGR